MAWVVVCGLLLSSAWAWAAPEPDMVRYVEHGDSALARGDLPDAVQAYEQARAAGAGSAGFLYRLGSLYLETGQPDKALQALRQSLKEKPGQLPVYSRIGEVFVATARLDSAIRYVREASALAPDTASIHSSLAYLLLQSDSLAAAREELDTALRLRPNSAEAHRYMGYYLARRDSVDAALAQYRRVTELVPDHFEAYNNMAYLYAQRGDYARALEHYALAKERTADPEVRHAIDVRMGAAEAMVQGKMRARYILVETQAEAGELLRRARSGEDFEELARRFSRAGNAADGGDSGYFGRGELVPAIEQAVLSLQVGQVSEVVQVPQGFMLIQRLN